MRFQSDEMPLALILVGAILLLVLAALEVGSRLSRRLSPCREQEHPHEETPALLAPPGRYRPWEASSLPVREEEHRGGVSMLEPDEENEEDEELDMDTVIIFHSDSPVSGSGSGSGDDEPLDWGELDTAALVDAIVQQVNAQFRAHLDARESEGGAR